jgi:hypothetical protein
MPDTLSTKGQERPERKDYPLLIDFLDAVGKWKPNNQKNNQRGTRTLSHGSNQRNSRKLLQNQKGTPGAVRDGSLRHGSVKPAKTDYKL